MNLAIDIGNTRVKLGVFDGSSMIDKIIAESDDVPLIEHVFKKYQIKDVIVCQTGERKFEKEELSYEGKWYELSDKLPLPILIKYKTPETLGRDRIAAVIGAHQKFGSVASLVVDMGTCITYDLIDAEGVYWGGNISPGLHMRYRAMDEFTHALPLVDPPESVDQLMGLSTNQALQYGGKTGILFELEGYIEALRKVYDGINIILTGGDAYYFVGSTKKGIFVVPDLVLFGLQKILRYQNHSHE